MMKGKKTIERILAVVLSVMMIITMIPSIPGNVYAFNGLGFGIDPTNTEFGGVVPVDSGNSAQLTLPCVSGNAQNITGKIQVKFPATCTDPKVILRTPGGTIYSEGSSEGNTNGLATYTTTSTPEALYNDYLYPKQTVYTVTPGTVDFGVSGITFKADNRLATQVLPSSRRIEVEVWYDGVIQDKVWIDNIKIDNTQTPFTWIPFPWQYSCVGQKVSINTNTTNWFALQPNAYNQQPFLDSASVTVAPTTISGPSSGTSTKENGIFTNLDPVNWTMTTTGPGNTGTATFTRTNFLPESVYIQPQFNIEYPAGSFHDKDEIDYTLSFDTTYYNGITSTDPSLDLTSGSNGSNGGFNNQTLHVTLTPAGIVYTTNTNIKDYVDSNYSATFRTKFFDSRFGTDFGASGTLGQYFVGNFGGTDAGPSKITLDFDTTDIGVKAVTMAVPMVDANEDNENDQTIVPGSVSYTVYNKTTNTTSGPFTYAGIGTPMKTKGEFWYVTANDLGLADDEYIDTYSYEVPEVPHVSYTGYETNYSGAMYYGEIFNSGVAATSTVKIEGISNGAASSQADSITNTSSDMSGIGMFTFTDRHLANVHDSVSVNAGQSGTIGIYIAAVNGNVGSTTCPTIYIRNPTGATIDHDTIILKDKFGNVVDHANLTITDTVVAGVPVVKIDTSAITDGSMVLNAVDWWDVDYTNGAYHNPGDGGYLCNMAGSCTPYKSELYLQWDFDTTVTTPSSNTKFNEMIFVQDSAHTMNMNNPVDNGWIYCTYGDPYSLTGGAGTTMGLMNGDSHFYEIKGHSDMVVDNAIKYSTDPASEYKTYSQDGVFLIVDNNTVDIRTTLTNNSEANIENSIIYIPIPKKGEKWSFFTTATGQVNMLDPVNGSDPFDFSVDLTGPVTGAAGLTVTYGNVGPSDRESTTGVGIGSATFNPASSYSTPDDWAGINCIKIEVTSAGPILPGPANAVSIEATGIKLTADDSTSDLQKDIWSPVFFERYSQSGVWYSEWHTGETMALQTQLGQIWGSLWLDEDIDGIQGASETNLPAADKSGWTVTLYDKADFDANGVSGATALESTTTDANGEYFFDLLDRNADYVLVTTNPDPTKYSFTAKGAGADNYLNNVFMGDSTQIYGVAGAGTDPAVKAARKVKETAAGQMNAAKNGIYPIGLRAPIAKMVTTPEDTVAGAIGAVGSTITYTIYYANTSGSAANITVKDTVPTYTTYASATGSPSTEPAAGDPAGSPIEWTFTGIASGSGGSVTYTVNVLDTAADQTVTNIADVIIGTNPAIQTNQVQTVIPSQSKTVTTPEDNVAGVVGAVGSTITYKIHYSNNTTTAANITVKDTVPTYTTYASATGTPSTEPAVGAVAGSAIEWTFTSVAPGVSGDVTFTVDVLDTAANQQVTNTAGVKIGNNPEITTNTVTTNIPSISKSVSTPEDPNSGAIGEVGSTITYTINYANTSSVTANVTVTDTVPTYTTYTSATDSPTTEPLVGAAAGSTIEWTIPSVAPGASGSVSFTVDVIDSARDNQVTNTAGIKVGNNPVVNTNTVITDIPSTVKSVTTPEDRVNGAVGAVGSTITYKIHYANTTPAAANVTVTDTVPTYTTYASASGTPSTEPSVGDPAGSTIEWTFPSVAPGASGDVTFTVNVLDSAAGNTVDNTATVTIDSMPAITTNQVTTDIPSAPVIATPPDATRSNATKEASTPQDPNTGVTGEAGSTITYTIWYENLSEASASNATIEITDSVPTHTSFLQFETSSSGTAIATNDGFGNLTWTIPGVASGTNGFVRFTVTVDADAKGQIIDNHAEVGIVGQPPEDTNYVYTSIPTDPTPSRPNHSSGTDDSSSGTGLHAANPIVPTQAPETEPVVPERDTTGIDGMDPLGNLGLPKTGEETRAAMLMLGIISLLLLAGAGVVLRRKTK